MNMNAPSKRYSAFPDNKAEESRCHEFLTTFQDENGEAKYMNLIQKVSDRTSKVIEINLEDIGKSDADLVSHIRRNTLRYINTFSTIIDKIMPKSKEQSLEDITDPSEVLQVHRECQLNAALADYEQQRAELLRQQALINANNANANGPDNANQTQVPVISPFPYELIRKYELHIVPGGSSSSSPSSSSSSSSLSYRHMRDIRSNDIGSLVSLRGIVTRVSDVQPLVRVVAYICNSCGHETYQSVDDRSYMPLDKCPSPVCKRNDTTGQIAQQTRGSKFLRFQVIKLQELPHEVPIGHIPRSITLRAFGSLTRLCKPGDFVNVSGIFLPAPYTGYRAIRSGLTTDTYIHVQSLSSSKKTVFSEVPASVQHEIALLSQSDNLLSRLASSIAPEIHGLHDVKKALMLLLAGGVTKSLNDGLTIRGDINILLCGDPGVAKSQLLKHITHIAPRCVYTTGKGSSGVGLTASVLRDGVTGDMTLEGGALVLADMGVCCIDEFDKMEEADRTAIHEVMEQQTVSIAKAGITTTLNARTSVLAAANPVWGRWRPRMSVEENVGLPTALLSRFDLLFLLLDTPDEQRDEALARHVTHVHMHMKAPPQLNDLGDEPAAAPLSPSFLRAYIAKAKEFNPFIPRDLTDYLAGNYWMLRKESNTSSSASSSSSSLRSHFGSTKNDRQNFVTARSLLSILRCSQAIARLHFRNVVHRDDVDEAIRLLKESKAAADEAAEQAQRSSAGATGAGGGGGGGGYTGADYVSSIYELIRSYHTSERAKSISRAKIRERCIMQRFNDSQINETLEEYEDLGIWTVTKTHVIFTNSEY